MADSIVAELRKIPPVTRFLTLSLVGTTIPYLLNLISPYTLLYHPSAVFGKLQIWRLYTSFFFGSAGINFIFEVAMLYQTSNTLETSYPSSADLAYQLFFACILILTLSTPLAPSTFLRPLMHCLQYLSSARAPPGASSALFGVLTVPVKYLPYTMLALELLMGGPAAVARAAVGTMVGHLWWWRVWAVGGEGGAGWARAPEGVRAWFGTSPQATGGGGGGGGGSAVHVFPPRNREQPRQTRTTGYNWGSGQRLGNQ